MAEPAKIVTGIGKAKLHRMGHGMPCPYINLSFLL